MDQEERRKLLQRMRSSLKAGRDQRQSELNERGDALDCALYDLRKGGHEDRAMLQRTSSTKRPLAEWSVRSGSRTGMGKRARRSAPSRTANSTKSDPAYAP